MGSVWCIMYRFHRPTRPTFRGVAPLVASEIQLDFFNATGLIVNATEDRGSSWRWVNIRWARTPLAKCRLPRERP